MNQIRPWLYVGKYRDTLDLDLLEYYQIEAMLQLAEAVKQPGIESLYLPIEDGEPLPLDLLRRGVDFVLNEKRSKHTILVACGAGQSRSVAFAIASLKEAEDLPLLTAYQEIKRRHPDALPHMALWESLCNYYSEPIPFMQIFDTPQPPPT
jgi:protein-tyrosine phosphatase